MAKKQGEQYVSGEEYHKMHSTSSQGGKKVTIPTATIVTVVVVVVLCGLSFAGGINYEKHRSKPAASPAGTAGAGFGRQGGGARRNGGIGQVTAISDTSITINDQRTNASKTYAINSSTAISDNGQTVAASDIKTGDTVLVTASASDAATATRILVNPSFGGGGGFGSQN